MKKIAINGFGRIGRLVFRELMKDEDTKVIAINDIADTKTLAHLLKYDTAHGKFKGTITYTNNSLIVNGQEIKITCERDPKDLPWKVLGVDYVVEATGFFLTREGAQKHIDAGAKKVLLSAPSKSGDVKTIVYSVNHKTLSPDDVIASAASCTTNALAPIVDVLEKNFGIVKGHMTTIHAYTNDQRTQDSPHRDLRRARAGAQNLIPTSTGAAAAIGKVLPQLNGKLGGMAVRVPVVTGSLVDLVVELKDSKVTPELINQTIKSSESSSLGYTTEPIVSSDIINETHGTIFDASLTSEIEVDGKKMFKLITWYDNESSYVNQFVRTLKYFVSI